MTSGYSSDQFRRLQSGSMDVFGKGKHDRFDSRERAPKTI